MLVYPITFEPLCIKVAAIPKWLMCHISVKTLHSKLKILTSNPLLLCTEAKLQTLCHFANTDGPDCIYTYLHNGFCLSLDVWVPHTQNGGNLWPPLVYVHAASSLFLCDLLESRGLLLVVSGLNLHWGSSHNVWESAPSLALSCCSLWRRLLDHGCLATTKPHASLIKFYCFQAID